MQLALKERVKCDWSLSCSVCMVLSWSELWGLRPLHACWSSEAANVWSVNTSNLWEPYQSKSRDCWTKGDYAFDRGKLERQRAPMNNGLRDWWKEVFLQYKEHVRYDVNLYIWEHVPKCVFGLWSPLLFVLSLRDNLHKNCLRLECRAFVFVAAGLKEIR